MGRARLIPQVFSRTGGRNRTPYVAILAVGILCIATPLLGRNALIWLVNMSSLCALFTYTMVAIAFVLLRQREPDLERPFKLWKNPWTGVLISLVAVVYTMLYIVLNLTAEDMVPAYAMIIAWVMAGVFLYGMADHQRRHMTDLEAEYMVFGLVDPRKRGDQNA